jgi:threonyl-tRNA synthetase
MTQNDAHIYCTKEQIHDEFKKVMTLTMEHFETFGLKNYWFRLSKWSPEHTDKYINEPENWAFTEQIIREVLEEMKVSFTEVENEAAFYGPKVDVQFTSVIGREETMSTIQLDFVAKTRFELHYIDETGQKNNNVFVIHRAPLSTHERFIGFLIEHYAGIWPVWLSPVQVAVLPISPDAHGEATQKIADELMQAGIRVEHHNYNDSLGKRIRAAKLQKVPYMIIVGDKEKETNTITVEGRNELKLEGTTITDFITRIKDEIANHQ